MVDLKELLACPRCKTRLMPKSESGKCPKCKFKYKFKDGIWELLYVTETKTKNSLSQYDKMHQKIFDVPEDGSYEILSRIARGNLTVDIACGDGFIEKLSPQTVGVEFSKNALLNAKEMGALNLVLADAHHLPFIDNSFEVSISSGNLEQFVNPKLAVKEMVRISKIQFLTVHKEFSIPFAPQMRNIFTKVISLKHQPIEKPIKMPDVIKMLESSGASIIYKGLWTIPVNLGRVVKFLPEFKNIPSCFFIVSIKR